MTAQPLAWLFPGQGSQTAGMGRALADTSPAARAIFDAADATLGFSLSSLCFNGPQADLDSTINTQPALLTTSVAVVRALEEASGQRGLALSGPMFCAGHSLGEYSALVAAGAVEFADALRLVRERGRLMEKAGEAQPGGMAALIGADDAKAEAVVADLPGVQVANFNAPGQIIVSGAAEGIARLAEVAKAHGVRKVIPLAVSIAAHSALMGSVVDEFRAAVEATPMQPPRMPVIGNVHARPLGDVAAVRRELVDQLTASVRWTAGVEYMAAHGVTRFIELGPGAVLINMVKRILKEPEVRAVGTPDDIQAYLDATTPS
ncbi:MAG: ACP S-malonyltransferase [Anaerolineae bacterium]|nr:ACP S-malonyltransferase [Anaerolineae bacterium]